MKKIAGSGSISQTHRSADPDPYKNVMDPEKIRLFWFRKYRFADPHNFNLDPDQLFNFEQIWIQCFSKRPTLWLASSKILTPHRPATVNAFGAGEDTLAGWRGGWGGGQYFGKRQTQLCTLRMQVHCDQDESINKCSMFFRILQAHLHTSKHSATKLRVYCGMEGCDKSFLRESSFYVHVRMDHKA